MKLEVQFLNAMKLFLLLRLLFWSFTWNIPQDLDLSSQKSISLRNNAELKDDVCFSKDENTDIRHSCNSFTCEYRKTDKPDVFSDILIPSFNDWRKKELEEYEKNHAKYNVIQQRRKFIRRKLNYASSKCGAKILSSNPESRNRMAVLSEKSDEYFLNPCRVRTWFVIELCDAVEVTQVEVANYELYSSSPKEFSIFWSEVFPTFLWHHLGTFTAEDKRRMQIFDVETKNMGKFLKVVINSHHGKEHYCPLSVIRVLGYSMEQTLQDIENNEKNVNSEFGVETEVHSVMMLPVEEESIFEDNTKLVKLNLFMMKSYERSFCGQLFTHCSNKFDSSMNQVCAMNQNCRFLLEIMALSDTNCLEILCPMYPGLFMKCLNSTSIIRLNIGPSSVKLLQPKKSIQNLNDHLETKDIIKDYEYKKSLRIRKEKNILNSDKIKGRSEESKDKVEDYSSALTNTKVKNSPNELDSINPKSIYGKITRTSENMCRYDKPKSDVQTSSKILVPQQRVYGNEIDSAGLINKESVLYKLTTKIKTSEVDLSLINKYLQKLSQSYRQHVEEMKIKQNKTFKEMSKISEKARIVNEKQEESILVLKAKVEVLNQKIDSLLTGKNDLIKRVFELHGFILILEVIVIATVFNIFMNIFHKKNILYKDRFVLKKH